MKYSLKSSLTAFLFLLISLPVLAQDKPKKVATAEFEVTGVCGMCKDRIENAALINGVKLAQWDQESSMLKVIYKTKRTDLAAIQKAVAEHGHDTEDATAPKEAYAKLPACCAYRDGVEKH